MNNIIDFKIYMQVAIIISNYAGFLASTALAKDLYQITDKAVIYVSLCPREDVIPSDYDDKKNTDYKYIARITYLVNILQSSYNETFVFSLPINTVSRKFRDFLSREGVGGVIALQPNIRYLKVNFQLILTLKNIDMPIVVLVEDKFTISFVKTLAHDNFCNLLVIDPKTSYKLFSQYQLSSKTILLMDENKATETINNQECLRDKLYAKENKTITSIFGSNCKNKSTIEEILKILDGTSYLIIPISGTDHNDNVEFIFTSILYQVPNDMKYLIKFVITDNSIVFFSNETFSKYGNTNLFHANKDILEIIYTSSDYVYEKNQTDNCFTLIEIEHEGYKPDILNTTVRDMLGLSIWHDVASICGDEEEEANNDLCLCRQS